MIRNLFTIGKTLTGVLLTALIFIFGEAVLIGGILFFGPLPSFIFFSIVFTIISTYIFQIYIKLTEDHKLIINKIESWIHKKEMTISSHILIIANRSKLVAVLLSSIFSGTLLTAVLIGFLGYKGKKAYTLIVITNLIFFGFWISAYSGAFASFKSFFT